MSASTTAAGVRLKKPSWKDPRLLLGFLLVLASVAGVVSLVGAADQTTEVYAAKGPIAVGEKLTAENCQPGEGQARRRGIALRHR